jgi:hypothetical protein
MWKPFSWETCLTKVCSATKTALGSFEHISIGYGFGDSSSCVARRRGALLAAETKR